MHLFTTRVKIQGSYIHLTTDGLYKLPRVASKNNTAAKTTWAGLSYNYEIYSFTELV